MNMTLSKRGDYVVRSALCLARAYPSGQHRKIRQVVAEVGVPQTYASQILADLVRAGLATSRAGRDGGYLLSRPPEAISVLEVVEAGEGPLRPERCALGDGPCRWDRVCPLHETWEAATDVMRKVLAETTLAVVAERDLRLEQGAFVAPSSHRHVAKSLAVEDRVQVDAPLRTALEHFQRVALVTRKAREAYAEADSLRASLDGGGSSWSSGAAPAVRIGAASECGEGALSIDVAWQVGLAGGSESRLEATIRLQSVDPRRTGIHLEGRFRPPTTDASEAAPDDLAERLSRVTVRAFLRGVALATEIPHA